LERIYDHKQIDRQFSNEHPQLANKIRVATTSLAGYWLHVILDIDERMLQLAEAVEFDRSPITDIEHCTIATSA
jgi:hypothetical protein